MYVYLVCSNSYKRTACISLDLRKCMPVVGTYSEGRIDPALWFKVLVLDSVFVDMDRQKMFWTCQSHDFDKFQNLRADNLSEFFNTQEEIPSMCENGDLDHNARMAELFRTVRAIYIHLSVVEDLGRECNESTYNDLLKVLHVYILPEVQFHTKDREAIHQVFEEMKDKYEEVEMLIIKKVEEKQKHEESLARQRTSLVLGHFIDEEFKNLLLKHMEKDVKKLEDKILSLSDRIYCLKHSESEKCNSKLSEARKKRTKHVKEKERLIVIREELKIQGVNQSTASQTQYMNESKELGNTNEDIKTLINSKIKLSGVREAVQFTLTELEGDGGKRGVFKTEADVFDPSKKPEDWKTLGEQVNKHLKINHSELKSEHDRFCSRVQGMYGRLLTTSNITDSLVWLESTDGRSASNFSMHYSRPRSGSVSKKDCENICTEVSKHILDMADKLADELQGAHTYLPTYYTHMYICYEKHVSEDIMAVLSDVYKESFRSKCEHLYNWVSSYATTELAFMDKLIKKLFPDLNERDSQAVSQDDVIRSSFFDFFSCVHKESAKLSIFDKLSVLSDAYRFVEKRSCDLLKRNGHSTELSTDDMLDLLILLVCKLDSECFLSLYADVNLINHLAPGFLQGSMSQYCLTTLTGVYQYLFEHQNTYRSIPIFVFASEH